jgi:hypothetical protein
MAKAKKVSEAPETESKESIIKNLTTAADMNGKTLQEMADGGHFNPSDLRLLHSATGIKPKETK